jgi:NADPH:quinone reductase-like Zn-dependent oxidoreductase
MRSVYRDRYGSPDVLEIRDVPKPEPRRGEVVVRVHAATVNRTDCGGLRGAPFVYRFFTGLPRPKHVATGTDFAGDVAAVGPGVTNFAVGDRVFGFDDNGAGTHAEYVAFRADKGIRTIPAGFDYAQAVACAEGTHYAINFLRKLPVGPGTRALVNGATGAIGSAVVQLLADAGTQVTAVCATPQLDLVRALGAHAVIDRLQVDFTKQTTQYDFVLDAVGKSTFAACRALLVPGGRYVSSELGPHAQNVYLALLAPLLAPFSSGKRVVFPLPVDIERSLTRVRDLMVRGKFRPVIDRTYPLAQVREAFTYVESGEKIGNVIVSMD